MANALKNFAYGRVATAPSPATSGTTIVVGSGEGSKMPSTPFRAVVLKAGTLNPYIADGEVINVISRSTDTLTVTRGYESSTPISIEVGDTVLAMPTAGTFSEYLALTGGTLTPSTNGKIMIVDDGTGYATIQLFKASADTTPMIAFGTFLGLLPLLGFGPGGSTAADTFLTRLGIGIVGVGVSGTAILQTGTIELGHATDTTLSRVSAGDVAVEGNTLYRAGGTDVPITDGGTGASTASGARTNLGLAIGTNVQAWDSDLDTWATKTAPSGTVVGTSDSQTLTNKILSDSTTNFGHVSDTSKRLKMSLGGATTGKTMTISSSHTVDQTLTLPDATDTLVGRNTTETLTNKTITSPIVNGTFEFDAASAKITMVDDGTGQTSLRLYKATADSQPVFAIGTFFSAPLFAMGAGGASAVDTYISRASSGVVNIGAGGTDTIVAGKYLSVPSTAQNITAVGNTILANAQTVQLTANASYTLTSAPTIANGTDGQIVTIVNVDTTDTITLQDQGTLASSNLRLSATTIALGPRDSIQLMYNSTIGDWIQIGQTNVL